MNVFEAVRDKGVTARQAAESCGFKPNRSGMIVCPFHNDKNPSMKVDRRYYCFGCGETGDAVDFVSKYYNLNKKEAAEKIASDFGIAYDKGHYRRREPKPKPSVRKRIQEEQFKQTEKRFFLVLSDYLHLLKQWERDYAPPDKNAEWHPRFVEALQKTTETEYLLDVLLDGTLEERAALIVNYGKEVTELERKFPKPAAGTAKICNGYDR